MAHLTPKEIVCELDKYIIGQDDAKKAVAIALRNRYRRSQLPKELQDEITPKNIIMIGPTGVGKTEIARRLSKLMNAPFVKVEATKFTEVGYVGRDVDSIVRDLVEASIRLVKQERMAAVEKKAQDLANERICDIILSPMDKKSQHQPASPLMALFNQPQLTTEKPQTEEEKQQYITRREAVMYDLKSGKLDNDMIEVEVEDNQQLGIEMASIGIDMNLGDVFGGILPKKTKNRKVSIKEAKKILTQQEADKLIDMDEVISRAIELAEQDGIVFLDEIDKIAGKSVNSGADVSREGVQRDILPIVEGSTVSTKYGPVKTDYMLFIAAGAFHVAKISDLIPELQGRFPIKVELSSLTSDDLFKILTQPRNAVTKQCQALLSTEGVNLKFTDEALKEIAHSSQILNENTENIGARRLHTILENILEDISFNAGGGLPDVEVVIDANYVKEHLTDTATERNLSKYII